MDNNKNMEINDNSNQQSLNYKDKDGSGNTWHTSKTNSGNQPNRTQLNNKNNDSGNMNINEHYNIFFIRSIIKEVLILYSFYI